MYTSGNDRFCYLFLVQMLITCKYSARQRLLFPVQLIEGISLKCLFTQGEIPKCFRTAANHLHMVPLTRLVNCSVKPHHYLWIRIVSRAYTTVSFPIHLCALLIKLPYNLFRSYLTLGLIQFVKTPRFKNLIFWFKH